MLAVIPINVNADIDLELCKYDDVECWRNRRTPVSSGALRSATATSTLTGVALTRALRATNAERNRDDNIVMRSQRSKLGDGYDVLDRKLRVDRQTGEVFRS